MSSSSVTPQQEIEEENIEPWKELSSICEWIKAGDLSVFAKWNNHEFFTATSTEADT